MARIYVKSHKEPFDIPLKLAEQIRNDWVDEKVARSKKISFSFFTGTLGDIKSFDMRSDNETRDTYPKDESPITPEEREMAGKRIEEIRQMMVGWKSKK